MATRTRLGDGISDEPARARTSDPAEALTALPPLESGDRLTRAEFERRYEAMPHLKRAELVEGVVYVPSPVRHIQHGRPHSMIHTWLGTYWTATPGADLSDNATVRLDLENDVQPDVLLRLEPEQGGRSRVSADGYLEGAPELIVEVAASSASYDLHDKRRAYQRNGVREYLVWRVLDAAIDWFILRQDGYQRLEGDTAGVLRSEAFPGLLLAVPALLAGDRAAVLAELQRGLASPEHAAFVERLRTPT